MEDFIKFCSNKKENYKLLFHNLKFDGEYIFSYLLSNGYELIEDKKERRDNTFTCIIGDTGQFYSIEIYFHVTKSKVNKTELKKLIDDGSYSALANVEINKTVQIK